MYHKRTDAKNPKNTLENIFSLSVFTYPLFLRGTFSNIIRTNLIECFFSTGDDKAQFFALRSAKALAMTALDVLMDPKLLQEVKREFSEARLKEGGSG